MVKRSFFISLLVFIASNVFSQSVTPSGAFSYTYPIEIPEGTNGIQPNISLTYNSQAGNGLAGVGWILTGFPVISRDNSYPVNWDNNDHFIYNGQRLIKDSSISNRYHTENITFEKIEYINNSYWLVTQKNGTKYYYGNTNDSKIEATGKTAPRIWALSKVIDVNGNYYSITYSEDLSNGDYYPVNIKYTLNDNGKLQSYKEIIFNYESRFDVIYSNSVNKDRRLKDISIFIGSNLYKKYVLDYDTKSSFSDQSKIIKISKIYGDRNTIPEETYFSWSSNNHIKEPFEAWSSINPYLDADVQDHVYLADVNGDGKSDLIAVPPVGRINSGTVYVGLSNGKGFECWSGNSKLLDSDVKNDVYFADVNGDGKSDLIAIPPVGRINSGNVYVSLSNGSSFKVWTSSNKILDSDIKNDVHFADVNGDGRADLIAIPPPNRINSGNVYVSLSNGIGYNGWTKFNHLLDSDVKNDVYFADINGDGKSDLVAVSPVGRINSGSIYVGLSNGENFIGWTSVNKLLDTDVKNDIYLVDVNGDGKSDLVATPPINRINSGTVYVGLSNGKNFEGWSSENKLLDSDIKNTIYFRDVNGDGKSDLIAVSPLNRINSGNVYVGLSNGKTFEGWTSFNKMLDSDVENYVYFGDINGDKMSDIISVPPINRINSGSVYVGLSKYKSEEIVEIVLPNGSKVNTSYEISTNLTGAINFNNSNYPYIANNNPNKLTTSVTLTESSNRTYQSKYSYYNGKIKSGFSHDKKSLGFEYITKYKEDGSYVKTYYYQDDNNGIFAGALRRQEFFGRDGLLYTAKEINYTSSVIIAANSNYKAVNYVKKDSEHSYVFNGEKYTSWNVLKSSTNVIKSKKSYAYDTEGNLIIVFNEGDTSTKIDDSLSVISYAINNSSYITVPYLTQKYEYPLGTTIFNYLASPEYLSSRQELYYDNKTFGLVGYKAQMTKKVECSGEIEKSKFPDLVFLFSYDEFGNIKSVSDINGNESKIYYDNVYYSKVKKKTNALGYAVQEFGYDNFTRTTWMKDINEEYYWYRYDAKNRVTEVANGSINGPTRIISKKEYSDISAPNDYPKWVREDYYSPTATDNEHYGVSFTFLDNFGDTIQTKVLGFDKYGNQGWITINKFNDKINGISKITEPYFDLIHIYTNPNWAETKHTTSYEDAAGRLFKTSYSNGFEEFIKYGLKDKFILSKDKSGSGTVKYETINGLTSTEYSYQKGFYSYNDLNTFNINSWSYKVEIANAFNASKITEYTTGSTGNSLLTNVDLLGRKKQYTDPNMGTWSYEYENSGNLKKQFDAKGNTITYEYDSLNRVVKKNGANTVIYVYDGKDADGTINYSKYGPDCLGQLTELYYLDGSYSEQFYFNNDTNTYKITKTIDGKSRTITTTLDEIGKVINESLPNSETISYSYREDGNLTALSSDSGTSYINNISYNHLGKVEGYNYGNGATTDYIYNEKYQLTGLNINKSTNIIANMEFRYDNWGNITYKSFSDNTLTFDESYTYDDLFRLKTADSTNNLYGSKSFSYDNYNNIISKNGFNYKYNQINGKPHAVSEVENEMGEVVKSYQYDENGNVTRITGQSSLLIKAKTQTITDIPGTMELWLDGNRPVKTWIVNSTEYQDYTWLGVIPQNATIDILFTYNKAAVGTKPDLVVDYTIINGNTIHSEDVSTIFDPGETTNESFDGLRIEAGKEVLTATGALRFEVPDGAKSPIREIIYDSENRVIFIRDNGILTSSYEYDVNGQRIKKEEGDITTYYFFNSYEEEYSTQTGTEVFEKSISYYFANGQRVAYTEKDSLNNTNTFYYHSDHLGSAVRITDSTGKVIQSMAYTPFGEVAWFSGKDSSNYTYTGQESDITGFMYYNARYYDPSLGRFLQADTYLDGLNRYTYCGNNPIIYNDPTGHAWQVVVAAVVGGLIGGYVGGTIANQEYDPTKWDYEDPITWVGIGVGAVIGAITFGSIAYALIPSEEEKEEYYDNQDKNYMPQETVAVENENGEIITDEVDISNISKYLSTDDNNITIEGNDGEAMFNDDGIKVLEKNGWYIEAMDIFHEENGKPVVKLLHIDGGEQIYDMKEGYLITNPVYKGTYNVDPGPYRDENGFFIIKSSLEHYKHDIRTWIKYGSGPDDESTYGERMHKFLFGN